jgi:hypothetical protein
VNEPGNARWIADEKKHKTPKKMLAGFLGAVSQELALRSAWSGEVQAPQKD